MLRLLKKYQQSIPYIAGIAVVSIILLLSLGAVVWFDEGYSIMLAQASWSDLFALTAVDSHPPLYYIVLKLWAGVFGWSELSLRALSAVCIGASVTIILALVRRLYGAKAMYLTIPALLFAPFLLRYGYEIRMYALATLIIVAGTYALVHARLENSRKWWIIYAVFTAAAMYTLYLLAAVIVAHIIWLVICSMRDKNWRWIKYYLLAAVLFAPYIAIAVTQLANSALPGIGYGGVVAPVVGTLSMALFYEPHWHVGVPHAVAIVGVLLVASVGWRNLYRKHTGARRDVLTLLLLLALLPPVLMIIANVITPEPFYIERYIAASVIFIYLVFGLGLGASRLYLASIATYALLLYAATNLGGYSNYNFTQLERPSTPDVDCTNIIVAMNPYVYIDNYYYLSDCDFRLLGDEQYRGGYAPTNTVPRVDSIRDEYEIVK